LNDNPRVSFLRIHRATLLVSVLLVASIAVSIYFGSFKPKATRATVISDFIAFSTEMDKTNYRRNSPQQLDNTTFSVSMKNLSNETITLRWGKHYGRMDQVICFDFYVIDANGTEVYRWSNENAAIWSEYKITLNPSEQWTNFFYWYQWTEASGYLDFVPTGTYSIIGSSHKFALIIGNTTRSDITLETPAISLTIK